MAVSSRLRTGAIALIGILALALILLTRDGADAASAGYRPPKTDQTRLILRLHDLPAGFLNLELQEEQGERILCSQLSHSGDTPPQLAKFVVEFHPKGCIATYSRLFTVPGEEPAAPLVGTGVMALGGDGAADAGWDVLPSLLGRLFHKGELHELRATEKVGSATRLFHAKNLPFPYSRAGRNVSFLAWRSGNTLATVMAVGAPFADLDRLAAEFAARQQTHIDKPTRYTRAERFDGDVPLDDPALDLPVYWLGMNFRPGHGLASNRFYDGYAPKPYARTGESDIGLEEAPGSVIDLRYDNFQIDSWTEATWPLYLRAKVSKVLTGWHCTEERIVQLPSGSATIYGGYRKNYGSCPDRPPTAFTAWVEIGGMHLVVNSPWCSTCIFHTPYDSFAGMEAIVRALKLRPKPAY